jgi:hypothetical protein
MLVMQMVREGGPLALMAVALGLLGLVLGSIALVSALGGNRAAFGLGVAALVVAALASGAGIGGTLRGKKQVDDALVFVDNDVDRERVHIAGYQEASGAATVGAFATLLPALLGAIAALLGARAQRTPSRVQGVVLEPGAQDETSGRTVLAVVFIGIGALAASGAWVTGHRPPPTSKFDLPRDDQDAWALARAVSAVENAGKSRPIDPTLARFEALPGGSDDDAEHRGDRACNELHSALEAYWKPEDQREWPRTMRRVIPASIVWRPAARKCVERQLDPRAPTSSRARLIWSDEGLLESPLLQDDDLRQRILVRRIQKVDAPPRTPEETTVGEGTLDKAAIAGAIRSKLKVVQACFERALAKNPQLEGKMVLEIVIGATGAVTRVTEVEEQFPDQQVVTCVSKEVERLKFPAPEGGGIVTVRYPFVFKAAQ